MPFGFYAIIYANRVNSLWAQGDYAGAEKAAADTKKWSIYGAVFSIIMYIIIIIFYIIAISATVAANSNFIQ